MKLKKIQIFLVVALLIFSTITVYAADEVELDSEKKSDEYFIDSPIERIENNVNMEGYEQQINTLKTISLENDKTVSQYATIDFEEDETAEKSDSSTINFTITTKEPLKTTYYENGIVAKTYSTVRGSATKNLQETDYNVTVWYEMQYTTATIRGLDCGRVDKVRGKLVACYEQGFRNLQLQRVANGLGFATTTSEYTILPNRTTWSSVISSPSIGTIYSLSGASGYYVIESGHGVIGAGIKIQYTHNGSTWYTSTFTGIREGGFSG